MEANNEAFKTVIARMQNGTMWQIMANSDPSFNVGSVSDGYHTFDELYKFRQLYNALIFNEWAKQGKCEVHKSMRHHDGAECFGGGWFVVVAMLPSGQITNHYPVSAWAQFNVPELEVAKYPYDGHSSNDVVARIEDCIDNDAFFETIPQTEKASYSFEMAFYFASKKGKKIHRKAWIGMRHIYEEHGALMVETQFDKEFYQLSNEDLFSSDWLIDF